MGISRRTVGRLLLAYGVVGCALVLVGALIGFDLAWRVEGLSGTATATLAAASRATEAAADAFVDVDASLEEARASSEAAGTLAREASGTLRSLAAAMDLSIFGSQPLAPMAGEFEASADQAAELADTLDRVGSSLGETRTDVARIGPELRTLGEELTALGDEPEAASAAVPLRLFVVLLLVWLVMQAGGSLFAGLVLLRSRRA
ncbi:MAG TPA: hypothetical protein VF365_03950 [Candidatus Limnocylindria bacterium]